MSDLYFKGLLPAITGIQDKHFLFLKIPSCVISMSYNTWKDGKGTTSWARHLHSSAHSQWGYLKDVPSPNKALYHSSPLAQHAEVIHWVSRATRPKAGARIQRWSTSDEPGLATESGYCEADSIALPWCRSKTLGCLQQLPYVCFISWCKAMDNLFTKYL